MSEFNEKNADFPQENSFFLEISATIQAKTNSFPDDTLIHSLTDAIRKKVVCYRETHELIDLETRIFESTLKDSEDD